VVILDTNVVSELMKSSPHAGVLAWVDVLPSAELFVASVTQAELLYGIALLPIGERRSDLARALDVAFDRLFRDRICRSILWPPPRLPTLPRGAVVLGDRSEVSTPKSRPSRGRAEPNSPPATS
jgi:PIN domain